MKKTARIILSLLLIFSLALTAVPAAAAQSPASQRNGSSIFCWGYYLLDEGSYPAAKEFMDTLGIDRVYQELDNAYLGFQCTADMVSRLQGDGIETVLLLGDRSWGLSDSSLSEYKAAVDAVAQYNRTIGKNSPITKVGLDVETYTYSSWNRHSYDYFSDYIDKMREAYNYAHSNGLSVIQIIPTHFDTIDADLFGTFLRDCCDELSIMNYDKDVQVTAIAGEVAACEAIGMPVETIFETMPYSEYYSVTEANTYYYEGYAALKSKWNQIRQTYSYPGLTVSYHHFPTVYRVVTGANMVEIYAYTNSADPNRNSLGQTEALESIILKGSDGSTIVAGIFNPNLTQTYAESAYLAIGVKPGVQYTITTDNPNYKVTSSAKTFEVGGAENYGYSSIKVSYVETPEPVVEPEPVVNPEPPVVEPEPVVNPEPPVVEPEPVVNPEPVAPANDKAKGKDKKNNKTETTTTTDKNNKNNKKNKK